MIREARPEDVPAIVGMGRDFLHDGPYRKFIEDKPDIATQLVHRLIVEFADRSKILIAEEDGKPIGVVAFMLYPHFYSGELTAQELIWYVKPEARNSFVPIALFRAAERLARELGAKQMQFSAPNPTETVKKFYEVAGYELMELGYQKAL